MLISLLLTYWNCAVHDVKRSSVDHFIISVSVWCLWLYAVTEILSIGNLIGFSSIAGSWILYGILQAVMILLQSRRAGENLLAEHFRRSHAALRRRTRVDYIIMILFALYGLAMLYFALKVAPYNCDSMIYHLSRIFNWSHNGSVAHFATDNWRETASTPFAEFVGLHVYILAKGNDHFINCIQAFSYLGMIYMVYRLAQRIRCDKAGARFAAAIYATTPIAFAEANTTQNDEFAALWLMFIVYETVGIVRDPGRLEWKTAAPAGSQNRRGSGKSASVKGTDGNANGEKWNRQAVSLLLSLILCAGFAYLTKPTSFPAIALFVLWMIVRLILDERTRRRLVRIIQWLILTAAGALIVIAPEVGRNLITYHAVSYYGVGARQIVGTARPACLLINFLKNLVYNSPSIYWPNVYWRFERGVYKLASILHVDINDWAIAETGVEYKLPTINYGCDTAVNFVMFALIFVTILLFLIRKIREKRRWHAGYSTMAFLCLFLILLIMRWEPYINRYLIGYFALLCPAVGMEFQRIQTAGRRPKKIGVGVVKAAQDDDRSGSRQREYGTAIEPAEERGMRIRFLGMGAVLMISAVEFGIMFDGCRLSVLENSQKPEAEQYFATGRDKEADYTAVTDLVKEKGYQNVGLKLDPGSFEYPMLRLLRGSIPEYELVNVESDTADLEDRSFEPECIIYTGAATDSLLQGSYECHGITYSRVTKISDVCWLIER